MLTSHTPSLIVWLVTELQLMVLYTAESSGRRRPWYVSYSAVQISLLVFTLAASFMEIVGDNHSICFSHTIGLHGLFANRMGPTINISIFPKPTMSSHWTCSNR